MNPSARESVTLLATKINVFTHSTGGSVTGCQLASALRTMYELTSAMKNINIPASASDIPVKYARAGTPRAPPRSPEPSPSARSFPAGGPPPSCVNSSSSAVTVPGIPFLSPLASDL